MLANSTMCDCPPPTCVVGANSFVVAAVEEGVENSGNVEANFRLPTEERKEQGEGSKLNLNNLI